MIKCIKSFAYINKNANDMIALLQFRDYFIYRIVDGIASRVVFSETKLFIIDHIF